MTFISFFQNFSHLGVCFIVGNFSHFLAGKRAENDAIMHFLAKIFAETLPNIEFFPTRPICGGLRGVDFLWSRKIYIVKSTIPLLDHTLG